jgi:hypothetical protein
MNKINFLLLLSCVFGMLNLSAQGVRAVNKELFGTSPLSPTRSVETPKNVTASDGLYERYVLIHWEAGDNANRYKVFRTDKANSGSLQEISHSWQQGTWLCDYTAIPGVPYYYSVMASNGNNNSKASVYDKGFVKKKDIAAEGQNNLSMTNERFSTEKQLPLMLKTVAADKANYKAGEQVNLMIRMENIFDEPTRQTEIRCFLSKDTTLDWYDNGLTIKVLASVPASALLDVRESVHLPNNLLSGEYQLIIVSSLEGSILNSRTYPVKITITR